MQDSVERAFQAYGRPLDTVALFKYLGQVLMAGDYNLPAVVATVELA